MESSTATTASVSCSEWTRPLWTSVMLTKRENPEETVHWLLCECDRKLTRTAGEALTLVVVVVLVAKFNVKVW